MTKYIKILFSLLLLLMLGGCRDDFQWEGVEVDSDEYLLAFTTSTPDIEVMGATRAGNNRDDIENLTLVIFKDGKLWEKPIYFDGTDTKLSFKKPTVDGNGKSVPGSIKMPKSKVTSGDWYLFANAMTEIRSFMSSKDNGSDISAEALLTGISYGTTTGIRGVDQINGESAHVMWGKQDGLKVGVGDATQTNAIIIGLERIYSRITVETNGDIKFKMTGARLNKWVASGTLKGTQSSSLSGTVSDTQGWMTPTSSNGLTWDSPAFTYTKSGQQLVASTYPYLLSKDAANEDKMMMLVKGRFNNGSSDTPDFSATDCFYAIPIPSCKRNGGWRLIINGALAAGQPTAEAAIAKPGGLSVVFEDSEPKIHNIISDGENVLAVVDSVKFNADGTIDGSTTNKTGQILAKARQKGVPSPGLEFKSGTYSWITVGSAWSKTKLGEDESNGLFTYELTRNITVSKNEGSERSALYTVKLEGTELTRDVVIYQKGVDNLKYSNYVDIKLTITGGASPVSNLDYIKFVNPKGSTATSGVECQGIQPEENGGRVRNLGLHMPMPNGGDVKYTYTLTTTGKTGNGDIYLNGVNKGKTLSLVYTDSEVPSGGTTKYSYVTQSDKIEIKAGDNVYSLDLYHTGFFHKNGSAWYYYEVMKQGERDLYWLDRNLGATSAGMGVRTSTGVMTSTTWPIVGDKAMGDYYDLDKANSEKPKGWDVPTYAQMRSMTVSSGFTINRMSNPSDHKTYLAPTFTFQGTEDGEVKSYSSYFPQNMLNAGGNSYGGDPEAGYYLTKTGAGAANWYQTMQFVGMNVTSQNINYGAYSASVRCCTGSYDPQSDAESYSCNVKGYTHVFLYYLNSDGSKTYLTTWPGEQIAVYESSTSNDIGRYHPFTIEPTMSYNPERLYVIFNTVNTKGVRVNSNMSDDDVKARKGTKFVDGGSYDKDKTPKLPDVKEGNWVANPNADNSGKAVYLRGNFTGSDMTTGIKATTNEQGIAKWSGVAIGTGQFKIYSGTLYSTNSAVAANNTWISVPANSTEGQNMTVSGATSTSKYDVEWDYVNKKIRINPVQAEEYKYFIRGNIWSAWTSGGWINNTSTTVSGSKTYYNNVTVKEGSFGIAQFKKSTSVANNSTTEGQDKWWGANVSSQKDIKPGNAVNSKVEIVLKEGGDNLTLTAGTYDIVIDHTDPDHLKLSVTRKVAVVEKKYLVIRVNENDIYPNQEYLYAWTSSNDTPFGAYNSAPFITGRIDGYKYWRVESDVTNLEAVILKTSMSGEGDTGRKKQFNSWTTETDATLKAKYNATTLLTINASSYITGNYSGKYINVLGDFNEWKDNGAVPQKNGATVHEVAIGDGAFKVKVWDGNETWYSTGGAIQQNTWIDLSSKKEGNNMSISGAQSGQTFRVEFDYNKKLIRVTPK